MIAASILTHPRNRAYDGRPIGVDPSSRRRDHHPDQAAWRSGDDPGIAFSSGRAARPDRQGVRVIVRFTRITPADLAALKQAVLEDLEAVAPGLRVLAGDLPLGDGLGVDLLACDGRGRLGIVLFAMEADAATAAHAVEVWDRTVSSIELLRILLAGTGVDLTVAPRLILVCSRALDGARRLGGHVAAPEIEVMVTSILSTDGRRGLLVERADAVAPPVTRPPSTDPALGVVPPGHARSLMRRVLEELRGSASPGTPPEAVGLGASIEVRLSGRPVAWMLESGGGVELRRPGSLEALRVAQDAECRDAVRFILEASGAGSAAPLSSAAWPAAGAAGPSAALSREEILEFATIAAASGAWEDPPRGGGFVEN